MSLWFDEEKCKSKNMRHAICIFGIEDLAKLSTLPHLYVNKMMPEFDFGAIVCWYEELFRHTYYNDKNSDLKINKKFYTELTHVSLKDFNFF